MKKVDLGGQGRLGKGSKIKTDLKTFDRSTFNMNTKLKTTVSAGTIVPVYNDIALPGTTHDIIPDFDMMTGPTNGPVFGSFIADINFFAIPYRLYEPKVMINRKGIGLQIDQVKIPQLELTLPNPIFGDNEDLDNYQVNPSHVLNYLGIRGAGIKRGQGSALVKRRFNGVPWLGYNDVCADYFANKQEGVGAMVHSYPINLDMEISLFGWQDVIKEDNQEGTIIISEYSQPYTGDDQLFNVQQETRIGVQINGYTVDQEFDNSRLSIIIAHGQNSGFADEFKITELFEEILGYYANNTDTWVVECRKPTRILMELSGGFALRNLGYKFNKGNMNDLVPKVVTFELDKMNEMRDSILSRVKESAPFVISYPSQDEELYASSSPYVLPFTYNLAPDGRILNTSTKANQDGLWLTTYRRDIFNAWLNTEALGIVDKISAIPVRELEGEQVVYINEMLVKQKVWGMFNAIQTNGADWVGYIDAVYDHKMYMGIYSPVYCGGITKELRFQQILSNSASGDQPLGTLAGRGVLTQGKKGGKITIKTDEPCHIMAVFTLTPRLDYHQGNDWYNNLESYDQFHSPWLDQIGFQDDINDKRAWWSTEITGNGQPETPWQKIYSSAGKLTAWIDYQTSYDRVKGNFAIENNQMWMVLARQYENTGWKGSGQNIEIPKIKDLTTYVDPAKWNYIFADGQPDAQNFWLECDFKVHARRKMSSKVQPNI